MEKLEIKPPDGDLPTVPDKYTRKAPDFTRLGHAENRVLHINWRGLRYGTDDKAHAASMIISVFILFVSVIIALILAFSKEPKWADTILNWLGHAFLLTIGVAIGSRAKDGADSS